MNGITLHKSKKKRSQSYDKSPCINRKYQEATWQHKTPPKTSITQRLRTYSGRSVGETTATQLVWLNRFTGPSWPSSCEELSNQHKMMNHREFTCKKGRGSCYHQRRIRCSFAYKYLSWKCLRQIYLFFIGFNFIQIESSFISFKKVMYFYILLFFSMENSLSNGILCWFFAATAYQEISLLFLVTTTMY